MSHKTAMFVGACALLSACHNGDNLHPADGQPQADAHPMADGSNAPQDAAPDTSAGSDASMPGEPGLILHYAFEDSGTTVTDTSGAIDTTTVSVPGCASA